MPCQIATYYNKNVFVDFYMVKNAAAVSEIQIDAATFGGYFYVEASTLFKDQDSGQDLPAEITFPNVKIQSNFTFSMAATGDPSTFSFVMDAMPGYTLNNKNKKVLCEMHIVNEDFDVNNVAVHDSVDYTEISEDETHSLDNTLFYLNSHLHILSSEAN